MKTCKNCFQEKPLNEFYKASDYKDGHRNKCKNCVLGSRDKADQVEKTRKWQQENPERYKAAQKAYKEANRIRIQLQRFTQRYGLTEEQSTDWWSKRQYGCRVCASAENLHFDHNHETGNPRGWLCQPHNMAIGLFKDDPIALRLAALYLEEQ